MEVEGTAMNEFSLVSSAAEGREPLVEAATLRELCGEANIEITDAVALQLVRYLDIVLTKNEHLNLTAIRDWDKALVLHLVDSLTFLEELDAQPHGIQLHPYLDMGCGAGFPGIPLALARPDRKGMLCDSVKKKVRAVEGFIDEMGLNEQLTTNDERLEILGQHHRRAFGCVVARAVAPLPVLVEYATPVLAKRGFLIVSKGTPSATELASGVEAAEICGLEVVSERVFELPRDYGQRTIVTYAKVREPEVKLPRAIGTATKEPLA